MGCVLYCKTLVIGDVGGGVCGVGGVVCGVGDGVCGVGGVCYSYFYLLCIDESDIDILSSLVDDDSSLFFVSFNSNKIGKIIVKKGV